ncbi:MAG TPA: energy transducer TonB [Terracidiphilus sp.]|jgi:hypothetical protein
MRSFHHRNGPCRVTSSPIGFVFFLASLLLLAFAQSAVSQTPPSSSQPPHASASKTRPAPDPPVHSITEDELKQQLAGKTFYLRGGYLDSSLQFDEHGRLINNDSARTSYTLSLVQIERVTLSKHKLQLEGIRYGLHFLGSGPTEDPLQASDKVRITPKKKSLKITIARAEVLARKKEKHGKNDAPGSPSNPVLPSQSSDAAPPPSTNVADNAITAPLGLGGAETQANANRLLRGAIDQIFSPGLDERMVASLPDYWKLYYEAAAAKSTYKPRDPAILRQDAVDQKARLISVFEPPSNDFAQEAGVAGVALYHVVVSPDGKPAEVAVGRPIGFGLDENAVDSIRHALFQPATKDGKPVPVVLDLLVQFRIYSKRTAASSPDAAKDNAPATDSPSLPGPYSANQPAAKQP